MTTAQVTIQENDVNTIAAQVTARIMQDVMRRLEGLEGLVKEEILLLLSASVPSTSVQSENIKVNACLPENASLKYPVRTELDGNEMTFYLPCPDWNDGNWKARFEAWGIQATTQRLDNCMAIQMQFADMTHIEYFTRFPLITTAAYSIAEVIVYDDEDNIVSTPEIQDRFLFNDPRIQYQSDVDDYPETITPVTPVAPIGLTPLRGKTIGDCQLGMYIPIDNWANRSHAWIRGFNESGISYEVIASLPNDPYVRVSLVFSDISHMARFDKYPVRDMSNVLSAPVKPSSFTIKGATLTNDYVAVMFTGTEYLQFKNQISDAFEKFKPQIIRKGSTVILNCLVNNEVLSYLATHGVDVTKVEAPAQPTQQPTIIDNTPKVVKDFQLPVKPEAPVVQPKPELTPKPQLKVDQPPFEITSEDEIAKISSVLRAAAKGNSTRFKAAAASFGLPAQHCTTAIPHLARALYEGSINLKDLHSLLTMEQFETLETLVF